MLYSLLRITQNAEMRKTTTRTRTATSGSSPGRDAVPCLVGAVLAGQSGEWTEARWYMGIEVLANCRAAALAHTIEGNRPATSPDTLNA